MPAHLSLATAIDKNRVASSVVYLILLEVDIRDPDVGNVIETIRCVNNNEAVTFRGQTYVTTPFNLSVTSDKDTSPSAQLEVYDIGQTLQARLQAYGRSLDWPARIYVVNASAPDEPTLELRYDFDILSAVAKDDSYTLSFTLGAENPLTLRFPPRQQFRNRCFWKYKGLECAYSGPKPSCDYTLDGANGCRAHDNAVNYGGFPGIRGQFT